MIFETLNIAEIVLELGLLFNQVVNPLTTVFKVAFQGICTFGVLIYKIEPHFELSGFIYVVKQRGDKARVADFKWKLHQNGGGRHV